jgi:hypothetical protein
MLALNVEHADLKSASRGKEERSRQGKRPGRNRAAKDNCVRARMIL